MEEKLTSKYGCIVLDLDGTLISTHHKNKDSGHAIQFRNIDDEIETVWVHKRPGFDKFINLCFKHADVGIWSMGQPNYVEAITQLFPNKPLFAYNWCDCDRSSGKIYKSLDKIPHTFSKIRSNSFVMIDDNPDILEQTTNVDTLVVPTWTPKNKNDTVLFDLIPQLFI